MSDAVYQGSDDSTSDRIARLYDSSLPRELPLDGFHPGYEKPEPEKSYSSDKDGLREAARDRVEKRRDPVATRWAEQFPVGVDPITVNADPKATIDGLHGRKALAADISRYREKKAALLDEEYRAAAEGRQSDPLLANERLINQRAWRQFGDMSAEDFEALKEKDPERYSQGLALRDQLAQVTALREQQQQAQEPQPAQTQPDEQEAANARAAEEMRAHQEAVQARHQHEQAAANLKQQAQQFVAAGTQAVQMFAAEFPEHANGVTKQELEHIRVTNPQKYARLLQYDQAFGQLHNGKMQLLQQHQALEANSAHAQQQQWATYVAGEDQRLLEMHPELKETAAYERAKHSARDYLTSHYSNEQLAQWYMQPWFRSAECMSTVYKAAQYEAMQKAARAKLNEHRKPVPPVQRPGVSGVRLSHNEERINALRTKASLTMREATTLTRLQRQARG